MRRLVLFLPVVLISIVFVAGHVFGTAAQQDRVLAQPAPEPSDCTAEVGKSADPLMLALGEYTGVTLVMTGTCGAAPLPVDLVIVADESNSMTQDRGGPPGVTEEPDPRTATATDQAPSLPTDTNGEPPFCPGVPNPVSPTPTRRPFQRTATPAPFETPEPLERGGQEDLIRSSQQWVRDLLGEEEIERDFANGRLRMGFVSFNTRAVVKQPLSADASAISSAVGRLRGGDITRINTGLSEATRILNGTGRRPDGERTKIIVVLSDFQVCQRDITGGGGAQRDGTQIVTVGMGRDYVRRKALDLASESKFAIDQRNPRDMVRLYEEDLTETRGLTMSRLVVTDVLAANMELVPDSALPPATVAGQRLEWGIDDPVFPLSLFYQVKPLDPGRHPISQDSRANWTDSASRLGSVPFPPVEVEVLPPTSTPTATSVDTPTATPTSTPTATPEPPSRYLPIAFKRWPEPTPTVCLPEEQVLDVALLIDTSTSMSESTETGGQPKIEAAIEAAVEFVTLLKPVDQATVVGFNATTTVAAALTSDKATLTAALQMLPSTQATGTSIDVGLQTALGELEKTARPPHTRALILLTDGQQTGAGGTDAVRAAAAAVKAAGTYLVTVGLGSATEIDEALLREIASSPAHYFPAPNAADLVRIYREIVDVIPCP